MSDSLIRCPACGKAQFIKTTPEPPTQDRLIPCEECGLEIRYLQRFLEPEPDDDEENDEDED